MNILHRIKTIKKFFCCCLALLTFVNLPIQANALLSPPIVHVIGDSHTMEFSGIPGCMLYWIGPVTMYRIGRDGLAFLNLPAFGVKEGQAAVFAFGEIDVRCHIGKQRDLYNRTLDEVIETLANRFIYTVLQNRMLYKQLICIVYSVTPPTNLDYNPNFPYYGSLEDRVIISKRLNERLSALCSQFEIAFLDVYQDYANADGTFNVAYSDGCVHIRADCNQLISKKLHQILISEQMKLVLGKHIRYINSWENL